MRRDPAGLAPPIQALFVERSTTYAFAEDRAISRDEQLALLQAAHFAPSWKNREPWRFVLCDRFLHPDAWQKVFDTLARTERPWAYNVALYVLVAVDLVDVEAGLRTRAIFDAGGAALQLCLEATARGLATHTTSAFDHASLERQLGVPEQASCVALVCVGHRADLGTLGRDVYRREVAPRPRSALETSCFEACWGQRLRMP